ncbi:acyl-CoA dehydrogenase family protein, partial [Hoeflea sp.]|uniref:acyl-CoA dehydrogenase family protein n=1 Tax=Hoeflea sp. TaxID=1940281 RepID=UPI0019B24881
MQFSFTEDQAMIRATASALVGRTWSSEAARAFALGDDAPAAALWHDLASAGFCGVLVPEARGGSGLSMVEAGIVLEALGSALAPVSFLATAVAAADTIARLGNEEQKARWQPRIAAGKVAATVVGWQQPARVEADGGLRGRWAPVPCAPDADLLVVCAQENGGETAVYLVETQAVPGAVADFPTMDRTRRQGVVVLEGARGERLATPLTPAGEERLRAVLLAGSAAEAAGGAARVLEMETRYACE